MLPARISRMPRCRRVQRFVTPKVSNTHGLRFSTSPVGPMRRFNGYASSDVGMAIERIDELLQPARMPEIVIARPREILGIRMLLLGNRERLARIVHEAKAFGIPAYDTRESRSTYSRAISGVASLEPSSTSTNAKSVKVCPRIDSIASAKVICVIEERRTDDDARHQGSEFLG